jgi:hypothetical protein
MMGGVLPTSRRLFRFLLLPTISEEISVDRVLLVVVVVVVVVIVVVLVAALALALVLVALSVEVDICTVVADADVPTEVLVPLVVYAVDKIWAGPVVVAVEVVLVFVLAVASAPARCLVVLLRPPPESGRRLLALIPDMDGAIISV